jgi:ATP-binding cassette subfamily B multidrug efflux pump
MSLQSSTRGVFATLFPYIRSHRSKLVLVFGLVVTVVVIDLLQPLLVKEAIDSYVTVSKPDSGAIVRMASLYLGLVLMAFGLTYYQDIVLQQARSINRALYQD